MNIFFNAADMLALTLIFGNNRIETNKLDAL